MGHGRALINVYDPDVQLEIYQRILKDKLSVRQTEQLVKNLKDGKPIDKNNAITEEVPKYIKKGIKEISTYLGHKVDVKISANEKGKIIIPFHSQEDFIRIKKLLE